MGVFTTPQGIIFSNPAVIPNQIPQAIVGPQGPPGVSGLIPNAIYALNYGVTANTQVALLSTWSNGGMTITTGASDPPFSSADVGKVIFGVSNCDQYNGYINGTTCFAGTITSVVSFHVCTISSPATQASSAPGQDGFTSWVVWGTDDTAALKSAWAATLSSPGQTLILPFGTMMVTAPPFINTTGSFYNNGIQGAGPHMSSSVIVPAPGLNYLGANALIYYDPGVNTNRLSYPSDLFNQNPFPYTSLRNFTVWGGGQDGASLSNVVPAIYGNNAYLENVWVVGLNWKSNNTVNTQPAMVLNGCSAHGCGTWSAGNCGLEVASTGMITDDGTDLHGCFFGVSNGAGLLVTGGVLRSHGCNFAVPLSSGTSVSVTGGVWDSFGDQISGLNVSGGTAHLHGLAAAYSGGTVFGITVAGGAVYALNSLIGNLSVSSGSFTDEGGNYSLSNTPWTNGTITQTGGSILGTGSITGVPASASKITPSTAWGTTGAAGNGVSSVSGNTKLIQFTVTAAGTPGASPTIAIVFPTPFANTPICNLRQVGGTNFTDVVSPVVSSSSSTGVTFTLTGTPVATHAYIFQMTADLP